MSKYSITALEADGTDEIYDMVRKLTPLTHHTWYTYWTELTCFGNTCFKAVLPVTGEIIGFITSHPMTATARLEWFCWQIGVCGPYRKQGLGSKLVEHVVKAARMAGAVALLHYPTRQHCKSVDSQTYCRIFRREDNEA